jgi:transcription elongation GreA/GreB family factor
MSRAFVKEDDVVVNEIPERPTSPYPNQITSSGLAALGARLVYLEGQHRRMVEGGDLIDEDAKRAVERDIRYMHDRIARAIVIDPATQPRDRVSFGAGVETLDQDGSRRLFWIVGEDEADAAQGRLSWVSPLARALTGARIGETVLWRKPAGDAELEITGIRYSAD